FLLSPGDVDGMAQACLTLLNDPSRHSEFRKAARQRAVSQFDTSLIVPQYEACYREIAARGTR
ncbi:MAG TPA: N-acetyl-alpha-D-glucosaminyl L-malate synthase BshA, partial [Candidatus Methylomirabilis sp.]|nr:N-acetyl-alpha-D-glucosaminyl L-malate synthase BshA [Candidatus Methylomirabilis sp.]